MKDPSKEYVPIDGSRNLPLPHNSEAYISLSSTLDDECHDAIREFIEDLSNDEADLFKATTKSQQLIDDLKIVEARHKKSSRSMIIVPKLKAFVVGVEQFGGALDIIAGSVSLMSPIWGSVRVVLKVCLNPRFSYNYS